METLEMEKKVIKTIADYGESIEYEELLKKMGMVSEEIDPTLEKLEKLGITMPFSNGYKIWIDLRMRCDKDFREKFERMMNR